MELDTDQKVERGTWIVNPCLLTYRHSLSNPYRIVDLICCNIRRDGAGHTADLVYCRRSREVDLGEDNLVVMGFFPQVLGVWYLSMWVYDARAKVLGSMVVQLRLGSVYNYGCVCG